LTLPFLLAAVAFLALLPVLLPLLRGSRDGPARASYDQAVYTDQLRELDRDIARGLLSPDDAAAARLEIQRRLLATDRLQAAPARLSRSPVLAALVLLVAGPGSIALYLLLGAPNVPDTPFASRPSEPAGEHESAQKAVAALEQKLRANPDDAESWLLYARSQATLNQWDKARDAFARAIALGQTDPDTTADHAEMTVLAAGGTVTPAAEAAFRKVLQADPANGQARYYLSIAAAQSGRPKEAIDGLLGLLADMPDDSPLRAPVIERIKQAAKDAGVPVPTLPNGPAPGPDAQAVADAANMSAEQRDTMVRGMVAQLAAKQQADPANLDGWLRLGQAYAVLGEADKAADAYAKAATLKPEDLSIPLQAVRVLLQGHDPRQRLPARAVDLLKGIEARDPKQPAVMWYLGVAAAQDGQKQKALAYWRELLGVLPEGSADRKMIQSAIDAVGADQSGVK
jgi:cytochrome c-type biogenesis protein CcmH